MGKKIVIIVRLCEVCKKPLDINRQHNKLVKYCKNCAKNRKQDGFYYKQKKNQYKI
jgi:predicted amidophosphoribosyltransferase